MPILAANLQYLFTELPFLERFEAAARQGFRGVEYQFPYGLEPEPIRQRLRSFDQAYVSMNFPAGDRAAGDRGIACLPDRRAAFRQAVDDAHDYARAVGCRRVNCLAGIAPPELPQGQWYRTLADNLSLACDAMAAHGIDVMLEPLNLHDVPGYCVSTSTEARQVIKDVGATNLKLQYDLYHMQIMEGDLARNIEANLDIIGHIQVADNPGRQEPGTGEISVSFIFELLDRLEYEGWVSCEYNPSTSTYASLEWARPYLFARSLPGDP